MANSTLTGYTPVGAAPKGVLTPQLALQQAAIQRRLLLAQQLQAQSLQGDDVSQYNNMRVVPRLGYGGAIAQIGKALLGGYEMKKGMADQADLAQQQYASQRAGLASLPGVQGDAPTGGMDPATATAAVNKATNPNNPTGISVDQAMWLQQNSPEAWQAYVKSQLIPTDEVRTATAEGRNLQAVGQGEDAKLKAQGVINLAPNSTAIVPGMAGPIVGADFTNGRAGGYDQNGRPIMGGIQGADVIAQQAGDTTRAQQLNQVSNVTMADGSVRPMLNSQAIGGGSGAPAATGGPTTMPAFAADKQATMQGILSHAALLQNQYGMTDAAMKQYIADQFKSNSIDPQNMGPITPTNGSAQAPQGSASASDASQSASGGLPAPVPTVSAATGIGQSTMDKALTDSRAKAVGDMESQINDDAATAITKKASNVKMQHMLPDVTTGPLASKITFMRNIASSLGVSGIKDPSTNQEFDKYAIQNALAAAKQVYGARLTNQDVQTQLNSSPGATLTEKANNYLIGLDNIKQDRAIQKQQVYNAYKQQPNADLTQFQAYHNKNYPDQGISASTDLTPGAVAPVASAPAAKVTKILKFNPATNTLEEQ